MSINSAPSGIGINVGHDETTSDYMTDAAKEALIHKQCSLFKSLGIMKMRINIPTYLTETQNIPFRTSLRRYATIAKSYGMYVIMGYKAEPLNAGNEAAFTTACVALAAWCVANGIDEVTCGNEEDLFVGFNNAALEALRPRLQTVCSTVKTAHPSIVVSTAITTNVYDAIPSLDRVGWKDEVATWSEYMKLNLHIYFSVAESGNFNTYADNVIAALGADNVYCGEYGVNGAQGDGRLSTAFSNDAAWVKELKRRTRRLQDGGWPSFYCFYYSGFEGTDEKWSAFRRSDQTHTTLLWELTNSRPNQINLT